MGRPHNFGMTSLKVTNLSYTPKDKLIILKLVTYKLIKPKPLFHPIIKGPVTYDILLVRYLIIPKLCAI